MSGPVLLWEHLTGGFVEPLDDFARQAGPAWDLDDFLDPVIAANRWTGRFGDPLGTGPLLEIPVNCESYNLAYVPDLLEPPGPTCRRPGNSSSTPASASRLAAAMACAASASAARMSGTRCTPATRRSSGRAAPPTSTRRGAGHRLGGRGGRDGGIHPCVARLRPHGLDRAALVRARPRLRPRALRPLVDSDHYVAYFEDAEQSELVGRIGYALPPAGPTGIVAPNLWTWSMVMNARSPRKDAAWELIQWATSSEFLLRSALEGNMNPTRASVWDDPSFAAMTAPWGRFHEVSRRLVEDLGRVLVRPAVNYRDVASRWTQALHEAYRGTVTVAAALTGRHPTSTRSSADAPPLGGGPGTVRQLRGTWVHGTSRRRGRRRAGRAPARRGCCASPRWCRPRSSWPGCAGRPSAACRDAIAVSRPAHLVAAVEHPLGAEEVDGERRRCPC